MMGAFDALQSRQPYQVLMSVVLSLAAVSTAVAAVGIVAVVAGTAQAGIVDHFNRDQCKTIVRSADCSLMNIVAASPILLNGPQSCQN